MINCIYKPKGSRIWRWKYRAQPGEGKIEDVSLGTCDKQAAEKKRADLLREREHERCGLLPSRVVRDAAQRKLADHLEDFLGDMRRRGRSDKHLANLEFRVGKLIADCQWGAARDVSADSFQAWRRQQEFSSKTVNDYLEAAKSFFNWLIKNGRAVENPLRMVEKVERQLTRERRAFTDDEVRQLLEATVERKPLYLLAVNTGLRRSELMQLQWGDLHLDAVAPFVHARASTTKNGKAADLPLRPEVVAEMRKLKPAAPEDSDFVFPRFPRIERFRRDLKKAGVAYVDAQGRFADFHSLRKTFGTNMARSGVPSRVAMALMRHSDRRLTDEIYTDENLIGTWSAVDRLPDLTGQASQGASQILVVGGQSESQLGTTGGGVVVSQFPVAQGEMHAGAQPGTSGQEAGNGGSDGARTRNLCRDRAAL